MAYSRTEATRPEHHSVCGSAREYFLAMITRLRGINYDLVDAYGELLFNAWRDDRQVFIFGNGGSAHTAGHHATDYLKTAAVGGVRSLRSMSLVDNAGLLTAIANDTAYDEVFRQTLEYYARPGDVAVAISASGNSPNVVKACRWAIDHGLRVVAITGFSGGALGVIAHVHIHIPSDNYGIVEDIQMSIGHVASQILREKVICHCSRAGADSKVPLVPVSACVGPPQPSAARHERDATAHTRKDGECLIPRSRRPRSVGTPETAKDEQ